MFNLEETLKNNFGYIFNYSNIINLGEFISNNIINFNNTKKDNLDSFLYKNFFNIYKTKAFIKKNINNFIV